MKNVFRSVQVTFLIILTAILLSGCAGTSTEWLSTDGAVKNLTAMPTERFSSHAAVRTVEETTKQKYFELEIAQKQLEIAEAQKAGSIQATTPEGVALQAVVEMGKAMGKALEVVAQGGGNKYEKILTSTPTPKGVVAETIDSGTGLVSGLANSPAALVGMTGYAIGKVAVKGIENAGDKASDNSTITKTTTTNVASGQESVVNNEGATGAAEKTGTTTEVSAANWAECTTSANGTPSVDEINGCMIGYGYATEVKDGVLYLDGKPYSGV